MFVYDNNICICLLCNSEVTIVKKCNLSAHYTSKQQAFDKKYPIKSFARTTKLVALKKVKPLIDADLMKKCVVLIQSIKSIPLSHDSATRRIENCIENVNQQLICSLKIAEAISIVIDESTDIQDVVQCSIFVRYVTNEFSV